MEQEEQKKRKWAIGISAAVHGSLLLLFILMLAWKEPNPPIPEYGIELNFGLQQTGSGNVQPETTQEVEEVNQEEVVEDVVEEQTDESSSSETTNTETEQSEVVEQQDNSSEANQNEGPDVIEEPVNENNREEVVQETTDNTSQETNNSETTDNQDTTENTNSTDTGAQSDESNQEESNGNTEETGDQGDETGDIDAQSLMGESGSNNGPKLELSGWKWDELPDPDDNSQESGKIVFEITVNSDGYIEKVIPLETTVTPAVLKKYREAVYDLTFSKTSSYKPAPFSKGKITFIIKAN
ncbi:MAG: hypothetical protein NXI20_03680 [bacterium]|nr:hypothetical protein [bacterium]